MEASVRKKDPTVDPELKEKAQGLRKQAKKLIEDLKANYFYAPVDEWIKDMQEAQIAMKMLVMLVQAFAETFSEKRDREICWTSVIWNSLHFGF